MKKSYVFGLALTLGALVPQTTLSQEAEVQSLRGASSIENASKEISWKRLPPDHDPLKRDFVQQPPLIPHAIESDKINLKFNKCLTCHSWANYQNANATKISATHFEDRDGNELANVSALRYFCTQCHVPQVEAKPLIENTFKPVNILQ
jgi:cytochrome c-type protein NapB